MPTRGSKGTKRQYRIIAVVLVLCLITGLFGCAQEKKGDTAGFRLMSSTENRDLEPMLTDFAVEQGIDLRIEYFGTIDMIQALSFNSQKYDAVWPSNSIWLSMVDDEAKAKIKESKFTSINPVIFAMEKSKAEEFGFIDNSKLMTRDILNAVTENNIKFIMPSATQTNSGASAYLGFLSTLAGNPQVLASEHLENPVLQEELIKLFGGVSRSSGSEEYSLDSYIGGDFQGMVGYESSIIQINQRLEELGRSPLYALYPVDGVSLSDSPFAYIDNGDEEKKKEFTLLQEFLLSEETQKALTATGRRAGYGGLVPYGDDKIFRPEWGIDRQKYISPIRYPSSAVTMEALHLYQEQFRKPSHTIFALDYSGSMSGEGYEGLSAAMRLILDPEKAASRLIQFSKNDSIYINTFSHDVLNEITTKDISDADGGYDWNELLSFVIFQHTNGGTNIYLPVLRGLEQLTPEDFEKYNITIVLMTDGKSNGDDGLAELRQAYSNGLSVPIFSIMFGSASPKQLEELAEISGGMVFDGKEDLEKAFQNVRGFN